MLSFFRKLLEKMGLATLFSYGVIGVLSIMINFLTFALLWDVCKIHYKIAVTISYFLSVLFNFTSNRLFTFRSGGKSLTRHLYRYLTMIGINYLITLFVMHIIVELLQLSPYIGISLAIFITAFTGFSMSRFWVFTKEITNP